MILSAENPDLPAVLSGILGRNGIVVVPCDTMYGIVGIAPDTAERIRRVKGRAEDKPFLRLIPDVSWVRRMTDFEVPPALAGHWPGPLTVIVPVPGGGSVALRVPDTIFLRELISRVDAPLFSTSVNRAGEAPLWRFEEILREFESAVDAIVNAGDLPNSAPSTIVDATARPYRIVRQGALVLDPSELS